MSAHVLLNLLNEFNKFNETSSPMGSYRSPWSQLNVWRHHNLRCSKADNSELETVTRN